MTEENTKAGNFRTVALKPRLSVFLLTPSLLPKRVLVHELVEGRDVLSVDVFSLASVDKQPRQVTLPFTSPFCIS